MRKIAIALFVAVGGCGPHAKTVDDETNTAAQVMGDDEAAGQTSMPDPTLINDMSATNASENMAMENAADTYTPKDEEDTAVNKVEPK